MTQSSTWQWSKASLLNLSQDKADTLLLLGTCLLILAPFSQHMPGWISVVWLSLLCWRTVLTWRGLRLPPQWLLLPIAISFAGGVYLSFGKLMGKDPGVSLLLGLLTCKLLEMHARRDLFVVLFLSYFLLLAQFLYDQSIGVALWVMLTLSVLICTQISFQYSGLRPSLRQRWTQALKLLGLAIPFCILTFFLFPRLNGPLWGMPSDTAVARSGLSDKMSPSDVSKLVLSEEIVFRAKFLNLQPSGDQQYWRGFVLQEFDGKDWKAVTEPAYPQNTIDFLGTAISQEITLEPNNETWLFAIDQPSRAPMINGSQASSKITTNRELRSQTPNYGRLRYEVASYPNFRYGKELSSQQRKINLQLPSGFNPQSIKLAQTLAEQHPRPLDYVNAILAYFPQQKFEYTLEPGKLGRDSVDDFLFRTKAGFCGHYSGAFVVLMRAAGIPARVITGYQGGSMNTVDGYFEVRQSEAHAWAEVWFEGHGWQRVDPTITVAPERIQSYGSQILNRRLSAGDSPLITLSPDSLSYLLQARMVWDALNNNWNQWVLNFNQTKQRNLLSKLGFDDVDWERTALVLFFIGLTIMALLSWPLLRDRKKLAPLESIYQKYCNKMAARGLTRFHHEGPQAYLQRIIKELPMENRAYATQFIDAYITMQYGSTAPTKQTIGQLKSLLKKC